MPLHQQRMDSTRAQVLGLGPGPVLAQVLPPHLPKHLGLFKCRVLYAAHIEEVQLSPYQPAQVNALQLVHCNHIDYAHKYEDRQLLQQLTAQHTAAPHQDIWIVKNGLLTDASYANVALYDGCRWLTPSTPLLQGTQRARLLAEGLLAEEELRPADLRLFKKAALINAMRGIEGQALIDVQHIYTA